MFCSDTTKKIKILVLTALMVFVWLILGMVYTERFVLPFGRLKVQLMPWTEQVSPDASLDQRLSLIEKQIDSSNMVAQYALMTMIVSFAALTIYLSVVYQQKQRRASEHLVLYLKNQEIWRRNEFIRYISATIGHEFKNNLGRIKRRIDMIHGLPQDVKKRIDDNMEKLFADIEIFKKISDEREASLIEFMKIYFKDMLNDLAVQYGDLADFKIREGAVLPMIYAAPPMLKTVFENVIDNAVKYKKHDQPRASLQVSCTMDSDGSRRYVTVSIRDEGVGMDEQQADLCFYKGRGSGESWGQGLYFAKYVVGLHAGKIRIGKEYTARGRGTEIIINLPFVEEALDV